MSAYAFLVRYLRFVVAKTPRESADVDALMAELEQLADSIENAGACQIPKARAAEAARALAGVAGFLQQKILPESVAQKHDRVEREVRWVIDTAMEHVSHMTVFSENAAESDVYSLILPPPP